MITQHNLDIGEITTESLLKYDLDAILVTPTETVATDGRAMVIVSNAQDERADPPADFTPFLVPANQALSFAQILQHPNVTPARVEVDDAAKTARLVAEDIYEHRYSMEVKRGEKGFPDWKAALPDKDAALLTIRLDLNLLIPLLQVLQRQVRRYGASEIDMHVYGQHDAIRFDGECANTHQAIAAALMPIRIEEK